MKSTFLMFVRLLILAFTVLMAQVSWAGHWALDKYVIEQTFSDYQWWQTDPYPPSTFFLKNEHMVTGMGPQPVKTVVDSPTSPYFIHSGMDINAPGQLQIPPSPRLSARLIITPHYKWVGSENEHPTSSFYIRERGFIQLTEQASSSFSPSNPYTGQFSTPVVTNNGFEDGLPQKYNEGGPYGYAIWREQSDGRWHIDRINAENGAKEAQGKTRTLTFSVDTDIPGDELGHMAWVWLEYEAQVCSFSLDVATNLIVDKSAHPRDKQLSAFALPNNLYGWAGAPPDRPIEPFWDGEATYTTNISPNLMETIGGNPTYEWETDSLIADRMQLYGETYFNPLDPFTVRDPETVIAGSRPNKHLHHRLGPLTGQLLSRMEWPAHTTTKVKIIGNNPEQSTLTAKAKIEWYPASRTQFRTETIFEVIDLDTGEITPLSAEVSDEEAQLDQYIAEIQEAQNRTFETGQALVEAALTTQMIIGSWFVPDREELILIGAGKVIKAVRVIKIVEKVASAVNKFGNTTLAAVKLSRRNNGKSENVVLRIRSFFVKQGPHGALPPNSNRLDDEADGFKEIDTRYVGTFCFAEGTPILLADGRLKSIENVKIGDFVLSKSESTGDITSKRVSQTFKRQAPKTLSLQFDTGESIETTSEHPFYVKHKGFLPAGILTVGDRIVTRNGTDVCITQIKENIESKTVYNFTVEDYHTYFVGSSALWVHNINCEFLTSLVADPATVLAGKSLEEIKTGIGKIHDPWVEGVMSRSTTHPNGGWTLRKKLDNGEFSDFYLQWHPGGSGHHPEFGNTPYWKFSSGTTGTIRIISQ